MAPTAEVPFCKWTHSRLSWIIHVSHYCIDQSVWKHTNKYIKLLMLMFIINLRWIYQLSLSYLINIYTTWGAPCIHSSCLNRRYHLWQDGLCTTPSGTLIALLPRSGVCVLQTVIHALVTLVTEQLATMCPCNTSASWAVLVTNLLPGSSQGANFYL